MFSSNGSQVSSADNYIENVFSTYLYTGNSSTQTITNNIDLSTYGGLVWCKNRTTAATDNILTATPGKALKSNLTNAEQTTTRIDSFSSTGFFISNTSTDINASSNNYASWTFRKQPKFFDVVTWTGNGSVQNISHNLGSVPGCIIVKNLTTAYGWRVYHRSLANTQDIFLNLTDAVETNTDVWNSTTPTSTVFTVGNTGGVNASGDSFVAYIFAHNAGGFGLTGTDNVISCGGFTSDASGGATVSLGYEPQWLLVKRTSGTSSWQLYDNMRGLTVTNKTALLYPNLSNAESVDAYMSPTATGFVMPPGVWAGVAEPFIYIAIRRGPMAVPTVGTTVFSPITRAGTSTTTALSSLSFPPDLLLGHVRNNVTDGFAFDRLRGANKLLYPNVTASEESRTNMVMSFDQNGVTYGDDATGQIINYSGYNYANWFMRRAPSFFDEVCYTGTGSARTITHNLTVAPQLMIIKRRSAASFNGWPVYVPTSTAPRTNVCLLNTTASAADSSYFNSTAPTSTVFSVDDHQDVNASGNTYVAYLFATCAGVSKVGSYTGTGATQTISCGFTGGARFVMVKRTDTTGDWYVWDTARGMVSGTDPSLLFNTTAAEVNANSIYTATGGFQIVSTASGINASGGSYIYFSVA